MNKSFEIKLNLADQTFAELKTGNYPWWENLKKNKDISIQIRRENKIDVYYNGGAVLKDLRYDDTKKIFTASIHTKYIPIKDEEKYKPLELSSKGVKFTEKIDAMELAQLENTTLKVVMDHIKKYFDSKSEKAIQYEFAKKDQYIIDTEFQINESSSRIDLVRLDKSVRKIVLIEVKTMGDQRLLADQKKNENDKENIFDQLNKYNNFAKDYSESICDYFKKVLQIKNDLGISRDEIMKLELKDWQVEDKPLLVFGDCEQEWINDNAKKIDKMIKDVAYGSYYYRNTDPSLDLKQKKHKNRHIYVKI